MTLISIGTSILAGAVVLTCSEETFDTVHQTRLVSANLALPKHQDVPPVRSQIGNVLIVAFYIASELGNPIVSPRPGKATIRTRAMLMPEAAVHKYDFSAAIEHKIGLPRKTFDVQSIPIPHTVDQAPQGDFRSGVFASDPPHIVAATRW